MKRMLIVMFAVILVAAAAMAVVAADKGPAEIRLDASMGTVTFDHAAHQQRAADCTTCHHQGEFISCHSCHDDNGAAPKAKTAFHALCKDCHTEMKSGPTKCKECHSK